MGKKLIFFMFIIVLSVSLNATTADTEQNLLIQYDALRNQNVYVNPIKTPINYGDSVFVTQFPSPDGATRGLTFDGTYLWSADNGDGNSVNGPMIYKLDASTGAILGSYLSPGNHYPCGLTWDGAYLWHCDFGTNTIYKIDTTTMTAVKSFPTPGGLMVDMAFDGEFLFGTIGNDDYILKFDTTSGTVVDSIHATYTSGNVAPYGLAWLNSGSSGEVWASDGNYGSNMMNVWDIGSSAWIDQWSTTPAAYPCGIAYDPVSGLMWVSCWTNDQIYIFDVGSTTGTEEDPETGKPLFFNLSQNVPNPLTNGYTTIAYSTTKNGPVSVKVYDGTGRLVKTLVNRVETAGQKTVLWNGKDRNNNNVTSGIYFYRLEAEGKIASRKMIVFR